MPKARVFFPQRGLDRGLSDNQVELTDQLLSIPSERRRFRLVEAVRVLAEVSGTPDAHDLTGRVKTLAFLHELGAEVLGTSMVLGDNAYEVATGWLGSPVEIATEEATPQKGVQGRRTDEELLAQFLIRRL